MDTITTENVIPEGFQEPRHEQDIETEVILRTEDLKEGMVVLVESMFSYDDPKEAEDPECSPYVIDRLKKYQTWRRITQLQARNDVVSWIGIDSSGVGKPMTYGAGHFFFVKKASMPETYPQPYLTAVGDLAKLIAQETSGMTGAIPEQEDFDLAREFVKQINNRD